MSRPVLETDLLKTFVAVADHRSFTRAAAMLNRTQSAVSMQIKRLEERLQVELLRRSKAKVELSADGERLLDYARRILLLHDEAVSQMCGQEIQGSVRLGVMDDYGTRVVPRLLADFAVNYPFVRVEVETGLTASMPQRLGQAYDLVIAMHPQGLGEGEFLRREQAIWVTGGEPGVEKRDPLPVALYPHGCLFRKWAVEALDSAGRSWRMAFISHSLATVEAVAAQGLAVTVVKAGTCSPKLRPLSDRDGMPALPAADIRLHRADKLSRAGTLLAEYLAEGLSKPH